jgi:hypothetical protein
MIDNDAVQEALRIVAEERRRKARERKERREAMCSAALFISLVAGSLISVYGVVALVLKLIFR